MAVIREVQLRPLTGNGLASGSGRDGKTYTVAGQTVELALASLCYRLAGVVRSDPE